MMNSKKLAYVALLLLLAVISFTQLAPRAADPQNHRHSVEQTDKKIAQVMTLSGGAAATSATLSLLPGDMCTPLAEQLAELAKYFLLILSSLYLEKFLISLSGYITFMGMVPLSCLLGCTSIVTGVKKYSRIAAKIALVGLIIFLIVPASVLLSDKVYQTQAVKVDDTIQEYKNLEIEGSSGGFLNEITSLTSKTVDSITSFIDNLLESLAVMIVTSCVIPILVFLFLIWLVKTIFSANNILTLDPSALDALADKLRRR